MKGLEGRRRSDIQTQKSINNNNFTNPEYDTLFLAQHIIPREVPFCTPVVSSSSNSLCFKGPGSILLNTHSSLRRTWKILALLCGLYHLKYRPVFCLQTPFMFCKWHRTLQSLWASGTLVLNLAMTGTNQAIFLVVFCRLYLLNLIVSLERSCSK